MVRMTLVASTLVAILGLATAPVASANTIDTYHGEDTLTSEVTDVCATPFVVSAHQIYVEVDRYDADGNWISSDWTVTREVDTFLVDGVPKLTSEPFAFHGKIWVGPDGQFTRMQMSGIVEKVYLPGGGLFLSAGFVTPNPAVPFSLSPDRGVSGDVGAFCAALTA